MKTYYPAITTRDAEIRALSRLAGPTKDLLFPLVRLQAWPRSKNGEGTLVERSLKFYFEAMGNRQAGLDLGAPRSDKESADGLQGRSEIANLWQPHAGFHNWVSLLSGLPNFVPTVLWSDDHANLRNQIDRLASLGRGLILRLRKSDGWSLDKLQLISQIGFGDVPIQVFVDCEQIERGNPLIFLANSIKSVALQASNLINARNVEFVVAGSSFPSDFASIDRRTATLDIAERQLYGLLRNDATLNERGICFNYGDHASVYAAERLPAFKGAPRVDYPLPHRWLYHRRMESQNGFLAAAQAVRNSDDWDEDFICWGTQEIRRAADGDLTGLGSPGPWTAIRLNIHLHRQAHFDQGGAVVIEEEWED